MSLMFDILLFQVVMSVAQLYWHLAPEHEVSVVTKSLVRLLRSHRYVKSADFINISIVHISQGTVNSRFLILVSRFLME